jgi:hypothetical protein
MIALVCRNVHCRLHRPGERHTQRSDAMTPLAYAAGLFAFLLIMLVLAWCSDEGL